MTNMIVPRVELKDDVLKRVKKQGWRRFVNFKRSRYHLVSKSVLDFSDRPRVPMWKHTVFLCLVATTFFALWLSLGFPMIEFRISFTESRFLQISRHWKLELITLCRQHWRVAAAEIDQVNSHIISRSVADCYYGLLCLCYRAWIHQKRSLGCSMSPIQWPALAGRHRQIKPPCCLPSAYLAPARASTPT